MRRRYSNNTDSKSTPIFPKPMIENISNPKKRLLLIDDDPNLILLVKDYLEFRGYEVTTAENGQEALSILKQLSPNMIICDIMMPEMDGYTFVQHIRENKQTGSIPVMFLSAKGQSQDRVKGLQGGADVYMVKPFEPEELVAQVEASLQQAKRLSQGGGRGIFSEPTIHVDPSIKLTRRELDVIRLLAQGKSNQEIAGTLEVSQRTIESHISNMLNKTNLHNRTELARWAIEQGWL